MSHHRLTRTAASLAALLGAFGVAGDLAFASNGPATPKIVSGPGARTAATHARLRFTVSDSKLTFRCSLDGAPYGGCGSPERYTGLGQGHHAFSVQSKNAAGAVSATASRAWTIDRTPPAISISFPAAGSLSNASAWSAGCSHGAGTCGTATDSSGIALVTVSIKRNATGRYWNGSGYTALLPNYHHASLAGTGATVNWSYALPTPSPDGQYTVHVLAVDGVGNITPLGSPATSLFTIDTTPPPAPRITGHPANPTTSTAATFNFTDTLAGAKFQCQLDGQPWQSCSTGVAYAGLSTGDHTFAVEAIDAASNTSGATTFSWTIQSAAGMPFTISGTVPSPLYPSAAAQPIPLQVSNPNSVTIHVTSLGASVQSASAPGCTTSWFKVGAGSLPFGGLAVAANTTLSVPSGEDPTLQMVDSNSSQDACRGATLTLVYTGSAHS